MDGSIEIVEQSRPSVFGEHRWPKKVMLFGAEYTPTDYLEATQAIVDAARVPAPGIVSCHAVHALVTFSASEKSREVINSFDMVTPDGQPVRWALNLLHGTGLRERVYGPELMRRVCEQAAKDSISVYLYGGSQHVSECLPLRLREMYPNLNVAGSESPPYRELSEDEAEAVAQRINRSGAGIVFIGLGCPKQDNFAYENRYRINAVQVCVGAAFDFLAGMKSTAPAWMQRMGLEWSYRLVKEPKRLWRRYLYTNSVYVAKLGVSLIRLPQVARQRRAWRSTIEVFSRNDSLSHYSGDSASANE